MVTSGSNKRKSIDTQVGMNDTTLKKRNSVDAEVDIISDLPNDVLYQIVERLPLQDAARTSVLSHKWHQIWTSIPSLVFDHLFFTKVLKKKVHMTHEFCSIVTKVLLQHESPILKFSLFVPSLLYAPDVTQWIPYLSRNGIRDFSLFNMYCTSLKLSSHLFSCSGLEKLKLRGCTFSPFSKLRGLPNLTNLQLEKVNITYSTLNDLIGSCPVLEKLVLQNCVGLEHGHLIIDAPNLRNFAISGIFDSIDVKNGENLVSASFVMHTMPLISIETSSNDLIKSLEGSSKLEMLALGGCFCRVMFEQGYRPNKFQKLRNLELLSLHLDDLDGFSSAINCIQSIPNIERLKISVSATTTQNLGDIVLDYNPDWTLHHLCSATVGILRASSMELKLIEYLLGCSPVLEKLSVSFIGPVKQGTHARMLMLLNQFRRVSQQVQVMCHEPLMILPTQSGQHAETSSLPFEDSSDSSSLDHTYGSFSDNTSDSDSSESSDSDEVLIL